MNSAQIILYVTPKLPVRGKNKEEPMLYAASVQLPVNEQGELHEQYRYGGYLHGKKLDQNWGFLNVSNRYQSVNTSNLSHREEFVTEEEARAWVETELARVNITATYRKTNY